jgi:hypothetical protein
MEVCFAQDCSFLRTETLCSGPGEGLLHSMTESFDFYPGDQVIWDPYSVASIVARYPDGLSIMCRIDQ